VVGELEGWLVPLCWDTAQGLIGLPLFICDCGFEAHNINIATPHKHEFESCQLSTAPESAAGFVFHEKPMRGRKGCNHFVKTLCKSSGG
jgi:hypothetical protein